MPSRMKQGYKALLAAANAEVRTLTAAEALAAASDPAVVLVDVRDPRELEREGRVPGAFHCPRGMLEFWIDPESPYAKPVFQQDKTFIFFCAAGWRSALSAKTAQDMGLTPVAHIDGGFAAWRDAGGAVEPVPPRSGPKPVAKTG
jgi:rhodanese-related sulfurtransferase